MAKGSTSKKVLVLDDEPEYLKWVEEFLNSLGLQVEFCTRLSEGLRAIATKDYRLFLVDMNVPSADEVDNVTRASSPLTAKYPGLALAIEARNLGFGAHSVIAYTVHDDAAIDAELSKLHARYVLKGRPAALKEVIRSSLTPPVDKSRLHKIPKAKPARTRLK